MTVLSGRDVGTPQKAAASTKVYLTPKNLGNLSHERVVARQGTHEGRRASLCQIWTRRPLRTDGSPPLDEDKRAPFNQRSRSERPLPRAS